MKGIRSMIESLQIGKLTTLQFKNNFGNLNIGNFQFWQLTVLATFNFKTFSFDNFQFRLFSSKIFECVPRTTENRQ